MTITPHGLTYETRRPAHLPETVPLLHAHWKLNSKINSEEYAHRWRASGVAPRHGRFPNKVLDEKSIWKERYRTIVDLEGSCQENWGKAMRSTTGATP